MTVRERMIAWRERFGVSRDQVAKEIGCSKDLLGMVEHGEVTHPSIAHRIGAAYGLSELETEELMPKNYRPHGGDYEPDRYQSVYERKPVCIPAGIPARGDVFQC